MSQATRNKIADLLIQLQEHRKDGELHAFIDWYASDIEQVLRNALREDGKHERKQSDPAA